MAKKKGTRSLSSKDRYIRSLVRSVARLSRVGEMAAHPIWRVRGQGEPARFIQGWVVPRGLASVTQALDEDGVVWERHVLLEDEMVEGKTVKVIKESWWEPLAMTRKGTP